MALIAHLGKWLVSHINVGDAAVAGFVCSMLHSTRSGPKSGVRASGRMHMRIFNTWILLCLLQLHINGAYGVKVGNGPTTFPGVGVPTKQSGRTADDFSRQAGGNFAKQLVRKRAYQRALIRAQQNGFTMYRGRRMTAVQASLCQTPKLQVAPASGSRWAGQARKAAKQPRLRVISHNLGGICQATFDNFSNWLEHSPYDIVLLQEIHFGVGKTSNEWQTKHWHIITSVQTDVRFAGVAVCVRRSLATGQHVKYQEVLPGRLLHVRVYPDFLTDKLDVSLETLCAYQHAAIDTASHISSRQRFWTQLSRSIASLPHRNVLLLGGDFNCTPKGSAGRMGAGLISGSAHPDSTEFRDIIVEHDLCVLNTWQSGCKNGNYTFMNGDRSSQIDYLMLRRSHADCIARDSCPLMGLHAVDHSPWRGGGKHRAITCSIPLFPGWRTKPRQIGGSLGYDKHALENAIRDGAQVVQAFRSAVSSRLAEQQVVDVDVINDVLLEQCQAFFPPRHLEKEARPWQTEAVQCSVRQLWDARALLQEQAFALQLACRQLRQVRVQRSRDHCRDCALLAHVFYYFEYQHRVQVIYKELKQKGKQARKAKLLTQLEKAGLAAERIDLKSLYQVLRTLAPKHRYKPVKIRGTDGAPISSHEEFSDILGYFDSLYSQAEPCSDPQHTLHHDALDRCPTITADDMGWALKQNALGKAVPKQHAPCGAWTVCSGLFSSELARVANSCLRGELPIPKRWSDCFLALIPKPNKRLTRPETLRPLGIQDAAGKSFARVLKRILLDQVLEVVCKYPQFAYLAKRSTYHAIDRVTQRCRTIRD